MKNSIKTLLIVLMSFYWSTLYSQQFERNTQFSSQLVYNYENQLQIVWFDVWNGNRKLKRIAEIKEYVKPLLGMVNSISSELKDTDPLLINVHFDEKYNTIKIDKSPRATSYVFKDSTLELEFSGKHLLQINKGNKRPIQIYFNSPDHLQLLEKIDFSGFQVFVETDLAKTRGNPEQVAKELVYISVNGALSCKGLTWRNNFKAYEFQPTIASMIAYSRLGLGMSGQISRLRYMTGNDNENHLVSKTSLVAKAFIWDGLFSEFAATYVSAGLELASVPKLKGHIFPFELWGAGFGVYALEGMNGYNLNVYRKNPATQQLKNSDNMNSGIYAAYVAEGRRIYISFVVNSGSFQKKVDNSFYSLTLGYKF